MLNRRTNPSAALIVASLLLAACSGSNSPTHERPAPPVRIETLQAREVMLFDTYVGSVRSRNGTDIRAQVTGYVTEINVRAGQEVDEGTVLMRIDQSRQEATVNRARAATQAADSDLQRARADLTAMQATRKASESQVEFARKQRERMRALFAANNTSRESFERATTELERAEAELAGVEAQLAAQQATIGSLKAAVSQSHSAVREGEAELSYYNVRAPIAGRLGDVPVRRGDLVTSSTLLTTLSGNELREVYVQVPVDQSPKLKPGLELLVVDEDGTQQEKLAVSFVSPQVDPLTQTVLVKAPLASNTSLSPGQYVRSRLVWERVHGPTLPPSAVRRINTQPFVFLLQEGSPPTVKQTPVELGPLQDGRFLLESGVTTGQRVVVAGIQRLQDGVAVAVQDDEESHESEDSRNARATAHARTPQAD